MRIKKKNLVFLPMVFLLLLSFGSCKKLEPSAPAADEVMDAPLDGLSFGQNRRFLEGAEEFNEVYNTETGLGPIFVANSCASCHGGDNRGHLATILTRFGQSDTSGNQFLHMGGPQIQNRAIPGHKVEQLPEGATSSRFIAPITAGLGFLELVPDADLLAMADPNDANADGISGVPNWKKIPSWVVPATNAISQNGKYICRFGRKAGAYNLHQQVVGAFNEDMGITTSYAPNNPYNYLDGFNPIPVAEPEVDDVKLNATIFYMQVVQTPIQRNQIEPEVQKGKQLFVDIGCENCHKQTLRTGYSPVQALAYKEFHPYTDLLLHDMGPGLDDQYTEGSALTSEWRTTPLWGLGLAPAGQGGEYFLMHDGRARSIEQAILMHGGEASQSASNYNKLTSSQREDLDKFLKSL